MTKTPSAVCAVFCLSKEPRGGGREPRCVQRASFISSSTESNLRDHIWKEINGGFDDRGSLTLQEIKSNSQKNQFVLK